ncbi:Riboflavin synthase alpha chain [Coemansia sp. RSA 1813]|nr:Riboflavin synthase alpha chain [Coemansia sp. RSA 1646]KAJ1773534.1 Riboflavin synthase alpha chain [Coemansia sp. RSA 1843]KAJ2090542.1 Riboflavin synthase alpha chain [Coemansia sp. RSA 986]KAJ2216370.1 Riboflavin synthase alpha chain [Coemansia sp. RSA 487]KAJ2570845.1 Riboflavin synthase alpha chain [Coemansia sp. RSA 1813]
MFTGIVECMGKVGEFTVLDTTKAGGNGASLTINEAQQILADCHLGDSISINGTCLTVTEFTADSFKVGLAPETLSRTNLGTLQPGDHVNLERALAAGHRFGGHFVQGHVDTTAQIIEITPDANSLWFKMRLTDPQYMRYVVPKGFIAIDGTSLTVCDVNDQESWFTIMLVAYTQSHVVLPTKKIGDAVNIEVDMLGKYVEKITTSILAAPTNDAPGSSAYIETIVKRVLDA